MKVRLVAGATLALMTMAMLTGCTSGDDRRPESTTAPESSESTSPPTPTPPAAPDPVAAGEAAVEACTIIAAKNFVEPGVHDVLKEASGLASDAAATDPRWQPLAESLSMLTLAYVLRETNASLFDSALPPADVECEALGVPLVVG